MAPNFLSQSVRGIGAWICRLADRLDSDPYSALPHPKIPEERLRPIRRASRLIHGVCFVALIGFGLFGLNFLMHPDGFVLGGHQVTRADPNVFKPELEWLKRLLIVFWMIMIIGPLWELERLFALYTRGILFCAQNVKHLRNLAGWMCIYSMLHIPEQLFLPIMLNNPPQNQPITVAPNGYIFIGILIYFLAWIMDAARDISDQQALTV